MALREKLVNLLWHLDWGRRGTADLRAPQADGKHRIGAHIANVQGESLAGTLGGAHFLGAASHREFAPLAVRAEIFPVKTAIPMWLRGSSSSAHPSAMGPWLQKGTFAEYLSS